MWIFRMNELVGEGQTRENEIWKEEKSLRGALRITIEKYNETHPGFQTKALSTNPFMFEVCKKTQSGKFENPTELISLWGEVLLDYEGI